MAADQAAQSTPAAQATPATQTTLCNSQTAAAGGGAYILQNDEWGSSEPECISTDGGADFTLASDSIANATSTAPGGYPSLYKGCHWGACTTGSGLPLQVSALTTGKVTTSWTTTQPGTGSYDVAYDIWFNQTPTTTGQPNGAELMIWLNHNGTVQPYGSQIATVSTGGHTYDLWFGNQGWNTISYALTTGTTSVTNLDIDQIVADAVSRGYIQKTWYLIDVEAGFELWQGGVGLTTKTFTVNINGSGGTPPTPTPTPTPAPTCSASYKTTSSRSGSFQAQVTLTNTSKSPVSGWKLGWTFPGDQKITNLWNGVVSQSGEQVTVTSTSPNESLAPGSPVTVGFTGTYRHSDASPSAFTLNGEPCTS
jgi:hypothetical protein